jgi:hypothetical protein
MSVPEILNSSVGIATKLWARLPGFDSRQRQGIILSSIAFKPALGPTPPLVRWVYGALSPGGGESGRGMKLTTQLHLMPWSRMVELYHHFLLRLPGLI